MKKGAKRRKKGLFGRKGRFFLKKVLQKLGGSEKM